MRENEVATLRAVRDLDGRRGRRAMVGGGGGGKERMSSGFSSVVAAIYGTPSKSDTLASTSRHVSAHLGSHDAQFVSRPYIFPNFREFFLLDSSTINIAHDEFCSLMSTDAPSGLLSSLTSLAWHHTLLLQRGGLAFSEASHIVAVLVNHWSFATCTPLYSSHFFVLRVCTL